MGKVVTSPVKRWPGTVTLAEPMTFPQFLEWSAGVAKAQIVADANGRMSEYYAALLPGILACVEKWELAGIPDPPTAQNFPATPFKSASVLCGWLVRELTTIINEDEEVPKV